MSEQRRTVEFLRRRYAAAILRDDVDTAGRLRSQLDGFMNQTRDARQHTEALQPDPAQPFEVPAGAPAAQRSSSGPEPRLRLVTPVTGLLEGRRGR